MMKNEVKNLGDCDLIALIRKRPALYNSRLEIYKNWKTAALLWDEIGRQLKRPAEDCRKRWEIIREEYILHMIEGPKETDGDPRKVKHIDMQCLKFLNKYLPESVRKRQTVDSTTDQQVSDQEDAASVSGGAEAASTERSTAVSTTTLAQKRLNDSNTCTATSKEQPDGANMATMTPQRAAVSTTTQKRPSDLEQTPSTSSKKLLLEQPDGIQQLVAVKRAATVGTTFTPQRVNLANMSPATAVVVRKVERPAIGDATNNAPVQDVNVQFLNSLLPDIRSLSAKNQRLYRQEILIFLNKLMLEESQ